jgi:uncharacterized protein (TIGR02391 family)
MNYDWMRQKLEAFLALCEQYEAASGPAGQYNRATMKPIGDKIDYEVPTVQRIIGELDQSLLPEGFGTAWLTGGLGETTKATRRALAVVRDREEWKINLAPDSPSLVADELHPNIWGAAAKIWEAGEYKHAAQAACTSLSDHIKKKAGSHLNERELVEAVFTAKPPTATQNRLHFPSDPPEKNWQSRQQGLHLVAQGAFAGIRNIAVHDATAWTEHQALEHLAVLSVVARWTDETHLVCDKAEDYES